MARRHEAKTLRLTSQRLAADRLEAGVDDART
jgi:hypothetical protein